MKKRQWILLCVLGMIALSIIPFVQPVRPFIQLAGEVYPGTEGGLFGVGITNTFISSLIAYVVLIFLAFRLQARSRTADEVPTGFYNFFEMILEGAYNFAERIAGPQKIKDFFPYFMTYILFILVANWGGLIPGWDSIGLWEHKPHFEGLTAARAAGLEKGTEEYDALVHEVEQDVDAENKGDLRVGFLLLNKSNVVDGAEIIALGDSHAAEDESHSEEDSHGEESNPYADGSQKAGYNKEAADWTIVPFVRPAATDMNLTLALAVISMVMVQFYGFKYLGSRGYLAKFFPFINPGFSDEAVKNPIKVLDPVVGILELVSEISKIISFTFRLLGNIFAGMVLLFVMASLVPVANVAFYGLEFFIGLIQALVFALLMLIVMTSATESHHDDHH